MTRRSAVSPNSSPLDEETRALVRVSAAIAGGSEADVRRELAAAHGVARKAAVEEIILQSYLFAGFPRALNAARAWRAIEPNAPDGGASGHGDALNTQYAVRSTQSEFRERGEATCRVVYGDSYEKLRGNIRALHPELDEWMIVDGYGKVLGRPGLDLATRELAIVAACAATGQQRQLHSHLHGALNAGASPQAVSGTLDAVADILGPEQAASYAQLFAKTMESRSRQTDG